VAKPKGLPQFGVLRRRRGEERKDRKGEEGERTEATVVNRENTYRIQNSSNLIGALRRKNRAEKKRFGWCSEEQKKETLSGTKFRGAS